MEGKIEVKAQLLVEPMNLDNQVSCYYTYMQTGNIVDKDGRPGAYIAVTIKINHYYADVQNMYNILDSAYKKYIIGTVVEEKGDTTRFLVSDFKNVESTLKDLEKELIHYLLQFSCDSDFVALNGLLKNGKNNDSFINLFECIPSIAIQYLKSNGMLFVSPFFPSTQQQQLQAKCNAEIQQIRTSVSQQITQERAQLTKEINDTKSEAERRVQTERQKADNEIKAMQEKYKDIDKNIADKAKKIKELEDENNRNKRKIDEQMNEINKLKARDEEFKKFTNIDAKLRSVQTTINEILGGSQGSSHAEDNYNSQYVKGNNKRKDIFKKYLPLTTLVLSLFSLFGICYVLINSSVNTNRIEKRLTEIGKQITPTQENIEPKLDSVDNIATPQKTQNVLEESFKSAKAEIIIESLKDNKMPLNSTTQYVCAMKNIESLPPGKFESSDFDVDDNKIKPKKSGQCKIQYVVDGVVVVSKTIIVE